MFTHINTPEYEELTSRMRRGQRWYKTPEGNEYPSVTTVLGCEPKPAIEAWKQALGNKRAKSEMERCSARGTAVHEMCEFYLNNEDSVTEGRDKTLIRLFNKMKMRLKKIDNIRVQEVPMYSDTLKIAGRVDCVGEYDGVLSIIDFKTADRPKTEDMIEDYFIQCTAYAIMYSEMFEEAIDDIVVIIAAENGAMPQVFKRKIDDYVKPLLKKIRKFYGDQ